MVVRERAYRDRADLVHMRQLLADGVRSGIPASYMHPGCLDWATNFPPDKEANRRNIRLWEQVDDEPSRLAAWAIYLHREGSLDLFVHPGLHDTPTHVTIMDEYLAWAEARARGDGLEQIWPFWALEHDTVLTKLMQDCGFIVTQAEPAPPLFARDLEALPDIKLPAGYTVQGVTTPDDGQLRARVTHAAFHPTADWDSYWKTYARFQVSPVYNGAQDLFVRSPDGRSASACYIWFDSVTTVGLFEPVATHPDFQRRGLGKAVMAEGMRRMKAAGMRRAVVGFDPNNAAALALYTSMGFAASSYFTIARKRL